MADEMRELFLWVRDGELAAPCPCCGKQFAGQVREARRQRMKHGWAKHGLNITEEAWLESLEEA